MKILLCISALACLIIIGGAASLALQQADRVASFSMPTQATVLNKRLEYHRRPRASVRSARGFHRPVVEFRYEVQGQELTAKTIFPAVFQIGGNLGRVAARAPLDRFEKGQPVTAYYIPESPVEACLIRQPSVLPYLFVLLPMILVSVLVVLWPVLPERQADAKRWKARVIAVAWHTLGLLALAHYLFVAGSDYGGAALALFGLYTQLGLIPVIVGLPADKSRRWVSRLEGAVIASLVGTFLGFWAGLVIGFIVQFASGSATATLVCWGSTPAVLAGLLAVGGWLGAEEAKPKTKKPKCRKPASRQSRPSPSSSQPLPPPSGPELSG